VVIAMFTVASFVSRRWIYLCRSSSIADSLLVWPGRVRSRFELELDTNFEHKRVPGPGENSLVMQYHDGQRRIQSSCSRPVHADSRMSSPPNTYMRDNMPTHTHGFTLTHYTPRTKAPSKMHAKVT
jgi:hypothetical protein